MNKKPHDCFDFSGNFILVLSGFTLLCMIFTLSVSLMQHGIRQPIPVFKELNISNLSLVPSGRPLRHPEGNIPAVCLGYSPLFGPDRIDPAYILLNPPEQSNPERIP